MKCDTITNNEIFVLDAFFHIFTLCLILGLFFFFVVSDLERKNLNDEMENAISKGIDSMENYPNNPVFAADLILLSKLYDKENEADKVYNEGLIYQCIIILSLLFFGLLCVWLTMKLSAHKCPNIGKIVLQNILLFGAIGIIEYLFFIHIASKFIPVLPSYMTQVMKDNI